MTSVANTLKFISMIGRLKVYWIVIINLLNYRSINFQNPFWHIYDFYQYTFKECRSTIDARMRGCVLSTCCRRVNVDKLQCFYLNPTMLYGVTCVASARSSS